jgi:hypothetical protein
MQLFLPLTWDLSRSKVHNFSPLAKRLGDGLGPVIWRAIFTALGLYKNPEEETGTL